MQNILKTKQTKKTKKPTHHTKQPAKWDCTIQEQLKELNFCKSFFHLVENFSAYINVISSLHTWPVARIPDMDSKMVLQEQDPFQLTNFYPITGHKWGRREKSKPCGCHRNYNWWLKVLKMLRYILWLL